MQSLLNTHGAPTVKPALRYCVIRLRAHPETEHLVAELVGVREEFLAAEEAHEDLYERWLSAVAVVRYLDGKLGVLVSRLSRDVLVLVDGKRKDVRYQKLFETPPSEGMKGVAGDPQERYVRTIIDRLDKDDALVSVRGHLPGLIQGLEELKTAVAARNELRLQEGMARRDLGIASDAAKRAYNLLYPRLQIIFPDEPGLVETFFRTLNSKAAADTGEDEGPQGPSEPSEE